MTTIERITELERQVAELRERLEVLEGKPLRRDPRSATAIAAEHTWHRTHEAPAQARAFGFGKEIHG